MRKNLSFLTVLLLTGIVIFSCKKETSCEGCQNNNKPPVAIAGADVVITLPTDSVLLDGSSSSDPDGTISSWRWTKISGPASFVIHNSSLSGTVVKDLVRGVYQFELKVTDDKSLWSKDTVQVQVKDPSQTNRPPVANAGPDQTITLPANTVTLDGSASTDPDNNITTYIWTKISGPTSFSINNASVVQTQVTNLIEGLYLFELEVTDAEGLFSKDTLRVGISSPNTIYACDGSMRQLVPAQLIPVGTLSQARFGVAVASAGNKILFAGGLKDNGGWSGPASRVDIYDIADQTWSSAELCVERHLIAAVANGNKIFFAGGEYGDGTWPVDSVDIYDVSSNAWSVAHLSVAGHSIAAASVGNKVLFAGGDNGFNGIPGLDRAKQTDIYDISSGTWTTALLSEIKRSGHAAVTVNGKVYFAGGETWLPNSPVISSKIDIYDNATNTWSTSLMQEGKLGFAATAIDGRIFWGGGYSITSTQSCTVEIRNVNNNTTSIQHLSTPGSWTIDAGQNAVIKDSKLVFYKSYGQERDRFDIYEITTDTWRIGVVSQPIPEGASIISVNNTIYIAGGSLGGVLSNQVWKLEF